MSDTYQAPKIKCSTCGTESQHRDHRWGTSAAAKEGWFFQRDGTVSCPEHVPDWVEEWRASRAR